MEAIKIRSEAENFTSISNQFIDTYMTDANGDFVKLYLYLAMLCSEGREISVSGIADHLNCTENDVNRGIRYWIRKGVLSLSYDDRKQVNGILLMNLSGQKKAPKVSESTSYHLIGFCPPKAEKPEKTEKAGSRPLPERHAPSVKVLESKLQDTAIKNLISEANAYCNRSISQSEMNDLIYISDDLHFSFDLCEYLLEYCASVGKTNFRYILAVAKNWYQAGINNRTDAREYSERYYSIFSRIMKALGITGRQVPASAEKQFLDKWLKEYAFTDQLILEACRRAILKDPRKANFYYVDGILKKWHDENVHSMRDIEKLDQNHLEKVGNAKKARSAKSSVSSSPSNTDFPQTDLSDDLKEIEQLYLKETEPQFND